MSGLTRTGPTTKDTSTVALGLAKILVGSSVGPSARTVTFNDTDDTVVLADHGFTVGTPVVFANTGGALPASLTAGTTYYVSATGLVAGAFRVSAAVSPDTPLAFATEGTGTHTVKLSYTPYIEQAVPVLDETKDSLGALNTTAFTSEVEYWKLESGFPMLEDMSIPLRESARLECEFKEIHPRNLAFARGIDASGSEFDDLHTGEIALGAMKAPDFVRMEAIYTYPNAVDKMVIIFPRANVTSSVELNFAAEDNANVPITIEAKRADAGTEGGHATWNTAPLGKILFIAG